MNFFHKVYKVNTYIGGYIYIFYKVLTKKQIIC